jgi:Na+-translocating ferredoxin:NAD+ oxidoreductase subunit B
MARKGLVMTTTKIEPTFYAPLPWLTGWGDWTAYYGDKETADLDIAMRLGLRATIKDGKYRRNIFRTVPIYETIPDKNTVAPYDNIREVVGQQESISVADCYCDLNRKLRGESFTEPMERCFLFGFYADYLIENGYGRKVSSEEALEILDRCKDAGLVCNTSDLENPVFICNCTDYCGANICRSNVPGPWAEYVRLHNYYATVDPDRCTGCESCMNRCHLKAISMNEEGVANVNEKVCVACGQCVVNCPVEALSLRKRPESELYEPIKIHPNLRGDDEYKADLKRYKEIIRPR